jgi:UDP-N-acetylglucosamine:LPS N-acetylglucosamine transferase
VLVLSAAVGEGHDAAAAALAGQVRAGGGSAEVVDGLALLGPRLARFVICTYGLQVRRAAWSWALLYAASRSRGLMRVVGFVLSLYGGRRLLEAVERSQPDCVVSTYPLVSAVLASLRRQGRLAQTCASLITDFDPHPGWSHPDLDANLGVAAGDCVTRIAPPLRAPIVDLGLPAGGRERSALPGSGRIAIISGGAWGVGNLAGAARAVTSLPGFHAVVITGRNEALRAQLERDLAGAAAEVHGYVDGLAARLAAADVVIQHAGGVTCLEAFAAARPVVMFDPLPGHGRRNARLMEEAGLASIARSGDELRALLGSDGYWADTAPSCVANGRALFDGPTAASALETLAPGEAVQAPRSLRTWQMPVYGVAAVCCAAALLAQQLMDPNIAHWALAL